MGLIGFIGFKGYVLSAVLSSQDSKGVGLWFRGFRVGHVRFHVSKFR